MTTDGQDTLVWARALIDGLAAEGVETVIVAPGSRSTPLVLAAHASSSIETHSLLDERGGSFFALGRARATSSPVAIITTSGTATANLHPAIMEADAGRVPLIAVTADRPPELHESGANQTIDQDDLYGAAVRYGRTLPEPGVDSRRLRAVRSIAARAVAHATGPPAGPVALNCPFAKPLEPSSDGALEEALSTALPPAPSVSPRTIHPDGADARRLHDRLDTVDRGVIVVGPDTLSPSAISAVIDLAEQCSYPILADPLSGLRLYDRKTSAVIGGYDGFLAPSVVERLGRPDLVVRIGGRPTSKRLQTYLDTDAATQVAIDPAPAWRDGTYRTDHVIVGSVAGVLSTATSVVGSRGVTPWRRRFERAESAYWSAVDAELAGRYFEGAIAHALAESAPDGTGLFAANSMPVRDIDRFARPRTADVDVVGNRGVSGIDGLVSTTLGVGHGNDRHVIGLMGDLAFYHDMNGLLAADRLDIEATFVVVNNDGGRIFHKLPIESFDPPFEELFATPHGLDFEAAAAQFGFGYQAVHGRTDLAEAFGRLDAGRQVIECHVDGERSHRFREEVTETLVEAVASALGE